MNHDNYQKQELSSIFLDQDFLIVHHKWISCQHLVGESILIISSHKYWCLQLYCPKYCYLLEAWIDRKFPSSRVKMLPSYCEEFVGFGPGSLLNLLSLAVHRAELLWEYYTITSYKLSGALFSMDAIRETTSWWESKLYLYNQSTKMLNQLTFLLVINLLIPKYYKMK